MDLLLSVIAGSTEETAVIVATGECISVGRTTAAQKSFPNDTHMSSLHFEVENFGDWAELRDKRSTNGTWLNNNRITAERLRDGDQIRAGTTVFAVQYQPSKAHSGPPIIFSESIEVPVFSPDESDRAPFSSGRENDRSFQNGMGSPFINRVKDGPNYVTPSNPSNNSNAFGPEKRKEIPPPELSGSKYSKPLSSYGAPDDAGGKLLDDIHRHLDKRLTPFGDSIDLSEIMREEKGVSKLGPVPVEAAFQSSGIRSPISDSSFVVAAAGQPLVHAHGRSMGILSEFTFFNFRLSTTIGEGLVTIVEKLSLEYSVQAVVHPQKIRQSIPHSVETCKALWSCYGSQVGFGPQALPWIDFRQVMLPFVQRLCESDALMIFFGNQLETMMSRLQQLPLLELSGFSEGGGFLNCFWPSAMLTMLHARGARCCTELFADYFNGLLMPSLMDPQVLLGVASPDLALKLKEIGFQPVDRLG